MSAAPELRGAVVTLRPAAADDIPALAAIRATPEVRARWRGGDDLEAEVRRSGRRTHRTLSRSALTRAR